MPRGTRKVLYAWSVTKAAIGNVAGALLEDGGYFRDAQVAAGAYPDASKGALIASSSAAISQCLSTIRHYQSRGVDAEGAVFYKIFGVDATNPIRALGAAEDDQTQFAKLDLPEYSVRRKVSLANSEVADFNIGDQLPQDI